MLLAEAPDRAVFTPNRAVSTPHLDGKATDDAVDVADELDGTQQIIQHHHNEVKAVKADDAEVPVHLWNEFILGEGRRPDEAVKLDALLYFALSRFPWKLTCDNMQYLRTDIGDTFGGVPSGRQRRTNIVRS